MNESNAQPTHVWHSTKANDYFSSRLPSILVKQNFIFFLSLLYLDCFFLLYSKEFPNNHTIFFFFRLPFELLFFIFKYIFYHKILKQFLIYWNNFLPNQFIHFHFLIWLHRQYWLHMNSHETSLNVVVLLTQRITL